MKSQGEQRQQIKTVAVDKNTSMFVTDLKNVFCTYGFFMAPDINKTIIIFTAWYIVVLNLH